MKNYDLVLVGAGLTNCTIAEQLKEYSILILDVRDHIGGNLYDFKVDGTYIHQYGPHIFHTPDKKIWEYINQFSEFVDYKHRVTAEIDYRDKIIRVPFPYSKETEAYIKLSSQEIIDIFFKGYTQKMWNKSWDDMPDEVRNRIPKVAESSEFFINQYVGMPKYGYTNMINNMISDNSDIILSAKPDQWKEYIDDRIPIVYSGRLDELVTDTLPYRHIDIDFTLELWDDSSSVVNFCHTKRFNTRKTSYKTLTGGYSNIVSYETARTANEFDLTPFYPITELEVVNYAKIIKKQVKKIYPNIILSGRCGTYQYIDMWQAIQLGLDIAKQLKEKLV